MTRNEFNYSSVSASVDYDFLFYLQLGPYAVLAMLLAVRKIELYCSHKFKHGTEQVIHSQGRTGVSFPGQKEHQFIVDRIKRF